MGVVVLPPPLNHMHPVIITPYYGLLIVHPHLLVPGHQRTVSTSKGCNQWLSLAKTLLKVALVGGNRLLVARTNMCGWAMSLHKLQNTMRK